MHIYLSVGLNSQNCYGWFKGCMCLQFWQILPRALHRAWTNLHFHLPWIPVSSNLCQQLPHFLTCANLIGEKHLTKVLTYLSLFMSEVRVFTCLSVICMQFCELFVQILCLYSNCSFSYWFVVVLYILMELDLCDMNCNFLNLLITYWQLKTFGPAKIIYSQKNQYFVLHLQRLFYLHYY